MYINQHLLFKNEDQDLIVMHNYHNRVRVNFHNKAILHSKLTNLSNIV